jgi:hypothetical protein
LLAVVTQTLRRGTDLSEVTYVAAFIAGATREGRHADYSTGKLCGRQKQLPGLCTFESVIDVPFDQSILLIYTRPLNESSKKWSKNWSSDSWLQNQPEPGV